jgi:hypothetical protein
MDWDAITHIRLKKLAQPDTAAAKKRWEALWAVADADGFAPVATAFRILVPMRNLANREAGIRADLRCWANDRSHGNNSQDKGWLELGSMSNTESC